MTEQVLTIVPAPASSIAGNAARVVRTAAMNPRVSDCIHWSSVTDRNPSIRGVTAPTLLTSTSSGPIRERRGHEVCRAVGGRQVDAHLTDLTAVDQQAQVVADAARARNDLRALLDERAGDRQTDPLARAGDEGALAGQSQLHRWSVDLVVCRVTCSG